jgi:hypothetical protein
MDSEVLLYYYLDDLNLCCKNCCFLFVIRFYKIITCPSPLTNVLEPPLIMYYLVVLILHMVIKYVCNNNLETLLLGLEVDAFCIFFYRTMIILLTIYRQCSPSHKCVSLRIPIINFFLHFY